MELVCTDSVPCCMWAARNPKTVFCAEHFPLGGALKAIDPRRGDGSLFAAPVVIQ